MTTSTRTKAAGKPKGRPAKGKAPESVVRKTEPQNGQGEGKEAPLKFGIEVLYGEREVPVVRKTWEVDRDKLRTEGPKLVELVQAEFGEDALLPTGELLDDPFRRADDQRELPTPRVCAAYVRHSALLLAGFHEVGPVRAPAGPEDVPPVAGVFVFDPHAHAIGSAKISKHLRVIYGMLTLLFASNPCLPAPHAGLHGDEVFFEERENCFYVNTVRLHGEVFRWIRKAFPEAVWSALSAWDLAYAVQDDQVIAVMGGLLQREGSTGS